MFENDRWRIINFNYYFNNLTSNQLTGFIIIMLAFFNKLSWTELAMVNLLYLPVNVSEKDIY